MRLPIALALGWPERVPSNGRPVDWRQAQSWTFEPVDNTAFPAIEVARAAGLAGGCAPAVFNAANEELVAAFHSGRCGFLGIVDGVRTVVDKWLDTEHGVVGNPRDLADVEQAEKWARERALAELIVRS
jgi:1-deoxy-D-xylulose-5-phosphate reductoisomerase